MARRSDRTVKVDKRRLEIDEFLVDREARNLTPKTLTWYEAGTAALYRYMAGEGITETAEIAPALLRRFIIHIRERHNPGGVFGAVKVFLRRYASEYAPPG